jgi:predicted CoA-binding protein
MNQVALLLDDPDTSVAVVGATDEPGKYGGIVYRRLKAFGYEVFAVNPNRHEVDGDPTFPNLRSLPEAPTLVCFVVPPHIGADVAEQALELGYLDMWFQPGAEARHLTDRLRAAGADVLTDACIMVRARRMR